MKKTVKVNIRESLNEGTLVLTEGLMSEITKNSPKTALAGATALGAYGAIKVNDNYQKHKVDNPDDTFTQYAGTKLGESINKAKNLFGEFKQKFSSPKEPKTEVPKAYETNPQQNLEV